MSEGTSVTATEIHPTIAAIELPGRMKDLPLNRAGYPVPWFVAWVDGEPDFRVMDGDKFRRAMTEGRCWLCGQRLANPTAAFVIGPMCAVNRTSAEPPSHLPCALYAARACPFLANPSKRRREANKPADAVDPGGVMITRNPGVALVWATRQWSAYDDGRGGVLFDIGTPTSVRWFAEGRPATRDEITESIVTGLPALQAMAEEEGPDACEALRAQVETAMTLLPA